MVVSCLKNALLWGQKISKTSFVLGERTRFRHESENPNVDNNLGVGPLHVRAHQRSNRELLHCTQIYHHPGGYCYWCGDSHPRYIKIWSINKLLYIWRTGSWKPVLGELKIIRTNRKDSHRWRDCSNLEISFSPQNLRHRSMQMHSLLNQEGFPILPVRFMKLMLVPLQIFIEISHRYPKWYHNFLN